MPRESVAARTDRLLDEYIEDRAAAKLAQGPRATTDVVLLVLEVSTAVVVQARRALRARGPDAAEVLLGDHAIACKKSRVIGEHETIKRLLALVPARVRARGDIYTVVAARALLAAIDRLQTKHGGKLAAVLDRAMENEWLFAKNPPRSVARTPLRWFEAALRRAVARKHGFAVVFDLTLL